MSPRSRRRGAADVALAGASKAPQFPVLFISAPAELTPSRSQILGPMIEVSSRRVCGVSIVRVPSFLDCPSPGDRNLDAHHLDSLTAGNHHLAVCRRKFAPDEAGKHSAAESHDRG